MSVVLTSLWGLGRYQNWISDLDMRVVTFRNTLANMVSLAADDVYQKL